MQVTLENYQQLDFAKQDNLLPAIVQHAYTGTVLMQGYMNTDALHQTLGQQLVTFYSRSKQRLWCKGESSGNTLRLVSMHSDCDADSLLVLAVPAGPTCHLGSESCFSSAGFSEQPTLSQLMRVVQQRVANADSKSYTEQLLAAGTKRAAQKVGEEGVEVALAAATGDHDELLNESADLLYHLLVVLHSEGHELADVLQVLAQRRR
ncbi:bifunctional phosphoribosyl-AMP cyclohydrolase/phosphoribosyl-ATP diphosphatase HisIE [Pseudidiomarina insulisalsae]|uniref:Histidine biosynthesis bifunctional protein HisIE n=1 Tax=Pseudidiomarina insulisalsae TaxID=575789 RepID=A0A432YEZ0_9GAMM|nr:bifunctional phosphoribosyl-AMP cyclohydrolase/phosphoribosyl-ATP diphosphatase HisIE [Pseudidiomarina insulisalsae]RUO59517.1 bifunctional phosphoribosyl-AMP cyclohydrolase/phosphoribosyl-ATP diphosphatase [Pseudidiomarina insulisalsae]